MPIVNGGDIPFTHISLEKAQTLGIVHRIVQDDQGFLWFGFYHGLLRYDGYQFRAFLQEPADPNSISGVNTRALFKDHTGKLWIGSAQSLDQYDPVSGVFRRFPMGAGNAYGPVGRVRDITEDRNGMIWLATDDGLKRLDPSTSKLDCYQHRQDDNSSIASNLVKTVLQSRDGTLWLATTLGLETFDPRTGQTSRRVTLRGPTGAPLSLDGNKVSLIEDHAGVLWISIPGQQECGLASFDPRLDVQSAYSFGPGPSDTGFSIIEDHEQTLWFANWNRGLVRFDRDRKRAILYRNNPNNPSSLSAGGVMTLMQDRDHRIWVSADPGTVDWFDPRQSSFRTYYHDPGDPNSLTSGAVVSALQDSGGILWIGSLYGLDRFDRKTGQVTRYSGKRVSSRLIFRTVHAIAEDRAGKLWFGEWGNGLDRLDPRTGDIKSYRHDPGNPSSLSHDVVESLFVDRRGTLWVGAYDALNRFDPKTERFQAYRSAVSGLSEYRAIAEDSSGALWLASLGNGLHRFDPERGQFTVYRYEPGNPRSLSNDVVNSVHVDRAGTVWAGTNHGLSRLDQSSHTFTSYFARDGLANSAVKGILEDERGDLWLSTADGLSRFSPSTRIVRNYYAADGLPGNDFRFGAASKSSTGEMFFGSSRGLLAFFPERVNDNTSPPQVVLTDFWLFGNRWTAGKDPLKQSISFTRSLTFAPGQDIFSFEFSALSYSDPTRNRYRYRLEGLEEQWNERDSAQRLVTYTTLAPGDYVFRVQGSNSLGVWNETGASVGIKVLGPWWTWWWVRALFMIGLASLVWTGHQLRLNVATQRNRELARAEAEIRALSERLMNAQEAERTHIAIELHDDLCQQIAALSMSAETLKRRISIDPAAAQERAEELKRKLLQLGESARRLSHDLHPPMLEYAGLVGALEALCSEWVTTGIKMTLESSGCFENVPKATALCVYRVTQEALQNIARHAGVSEAEMVLTESHGLLSLTISDRGVGFDPAQTKPAGGLGLVSIKERVRSVNGTFELISAEGQGTTLKITIPIPSTLELASD